MVHTCRTFMRDGTVVESPANALNEVTPDAVARAATFLDLREMVISHVATEVGCVLDLDYEVRDREPGPLPAWGEVFLQGPWPVREVTVRLAPADLPAALVHGDALRNVAVIPPGGRMWTLRDLPALPLDGAGAHAGDITPHIIVSAARNKKDLLTPLARCVAAATGDIGDGLRAWLEDGKDLTPLDTVQRIAHLAHAGVRKVDLPTGLWSRAPRPVAEVYASAVATPLEQALLAAALLRAAGLQPEIGLFSRWTQPARSVEALGHYDELRLVVPVAGENWWLAPERDEAWASQCDLTGRVALFLDGEGGSRTWEVPAGHGSCTLAVEIAPAADDGLRAVADLRCDGALRDGAEAGNDLADALAKSMGEDAELTTSDVALQTPQAVTLRLEAKLPQLAVPTDGLVVYQPPWPRNAALAHLPAGFRAEAPARQAPLFVDDALQEHVTVTITLPQGLVVDALPAAASLSCALGSYDLAVTATEHEIVLCRTLALQAGRCEPADYPALRAMLATALRQDQQPLVLRIE